MSQSTPISNLPPTINEENPQHIPYIQQIMDEIHAEDMRTHNGGGGEYDNMIQQHHDQQQQQQYPQQQQQQQHPDAPRQTTEYINNEETDSFTDFLWQELRDPLLFMVFFVLFNLPPIVYVLSKYIPWMINYNTGSATYIGLFVRGFLAGLLYWLLRHYIL